MNLATISDTILDENSSPDALRHALDAFISLCSDITHVRPNPSFDAWAQDALLEDGVAINPQAAAHCAADYTRSVVFIRGVYAAIKTLKLRFPDTPLEVLYAGCGPFATLLLPLLGKFSPGDLKLTLLDYHQSSLDSVERLLAHFGLQTHGIQTIKEDACGYQHAVKLHLVVAETMQKSLEQEPQFAVTANLAPQLRLGGVFLPERIEVTLALTNLQREKEWFDGSPATGLIDFEKAGRQSLATVFTLLPQSALAQKRGAQVNEEHSGSALEPTIVVIPTIAGVDELDAALFTRICVFEQYWLNDYEAQITLPLTCHELLPLTGGERYRVSYHLGSYPKFDFERLSKP